MKTVIYKRVDKLLNCCGSQVINVYTNIFYLIT